MGICFSALRAHVLIPENLSQAQKQNRNHCHVATQTQHLGSFRRGGRAVPPPHTPAVGVSSGCQKRCEHQSPQHNIYCVAGRPLPFHLGLVSTVPRKHLDVPISAHVSDPCDVLLKVSVLTMWNFTRTVGMCCLCPPQRVDQLVLPGPL